MGRGGQQRLSEIASQPINPTAPLGLVRMLQYFMVLVMFATGL